MKISLSLEPLLQTISISQKGFLAIAQKLHTPMPALASNVACMASYRDKTPVCAIRIHFMNACDVSFASFASPVSTVGIIEAAASHAEYGALRDTMQVSRKKFPKNIPLVCQVSRKNKNLSDYMTQEASLCGENDSTWLFLI